MRIRVALAAAVLGALLVALPASAKQVDEYVLEGGTVYPEGVAFDSRTQVFYVSSTTDGAIVRGEIGDPQTEIFLPGNTDGRTTATGLEVDAEGRLYVSGGMSGRVFVYDTATRELLTTFTATSSPAFINDVAITRDGDAFFTDSLNPVLYRLYEDEAGDWQFEEWLDFTGTAFEYGPGFNANGIEVTPDDRYLLVIQSNTGELFRIALETKAVVQVDTGDAVLTAGDGMVLRGRSIHVVRNSAALIAEVRLSGDYARGTLIGVTMDGSFAFPTTAAIANGRLLVVNSQFDKRMAGNPVLPFTVSSVPVP